MTKTTIKRTVQSVQVEKSPAALLREHTLILAKFVSMPFVPSGDPKADVVRVDSYIMSRMGLIAGRSKSDAAKVGEALRRLNHEAAVIQ